MLDIRTLNSLSILGNCWTTTPHAFKLPNAWKLTTYLSKKQEYNANNNGMCSFCPSLRGCTRHSTRSQIMATENGGEGPTLINSIEMNIKSTENMLAGYQWCQCPQDHELSTALTGWAKNSIGMQSYRCDPAQNELQPNSKGWPSGFSGRKMERKYTVPNEQWLFSICNGQLLSNNLQERFSALGLTTVQ